MNFLILSLFFVTYFSERYISFILVHFFLKVYFFRTEGLFVSLPLGNIQLIGYSHNIIRYWK